MEEIQRKARSNHCYDCTHACTNTHTSMLTSAPTLFVQKDDVMPSENMWGDRGLGGGGDSFGSFQVCRGSLRPLRGRQYEGKRLNDATPFIPTPPQRAVTLGTLRPRHQRLALASAHTKAGMLLPPGSVFGPQSNEHVNTQEQTRA